MTEDRKYDGFFETMSIAGNFSIAEMSHSDGVLTSRASRLRGIFKHWKEMLYIKSIDDSTTAVELSGSNQQKLVIARSLQEGPRIVILDEPTRGVDVEAIAEIHTAINSFADAGYAVIFISSHLPEVMAMADRILVSRAGKIVEEFSPQTTGDEQILYAAVH